MKIKTRTLVFIVGLLGLVHAGMAQTQPGFPSFDECAYGNTPMNKQVRYSVLTRSATLKTYCSDDSVQPPTIDDPFGHPYTNSYSDISFINADRKITIITEGATSSYEQQLATECGYDCGNYCDYVLREGYIANNYVHGTNLMDLPYGVQLISESHSATEYIVSLTITNSTPSNEIRYWVATWRASLSGPLNADACVEVNHGLDHGQTCECDGMPVWQVTEPYLNLWVKDRPVYYTTSLGEKLAFEIAYKQHDTRPTDTDVPVTDWSHNWFSCIHFTVPVYLSGTNTSDSGFSLNGISGPIQVRSNWRFTNSVNQWKAILYSTDNGENYFDSDSSIDAKHGLRLMPLDGVNSTNGFRLVHADGSQDIYDLVTSPKYTLGIARRLGRVYDANFDLRGVVMFGGKYYITNTSGTYGSTAEDSTPNYEVPCGYHAYDAVLTRRIDPYGNTITLDYGTDGFRLKRIIDYDTRVTTLSYDGNGCLTNVSMPYGKSASFGYHSNGRLAWVKDAVGLSNSFAYSASGTNVYLSSMTTPYGTTHFDHYEAVPTISFTNPPFITWGIVNGNMTSTTNSSGTVDICVGNYGGEKRVCKSLWVTHPDNSRQLYVYRYDSVGLVASNIANVEIPNAISVFGCVDDGSDTNGNTLPHLVSTRNTWHWNRRQCDLLSTTNISSLTSADFTLGNQSHWLQSEGSWSEFNVTPENLVSDQVSIVRAASPDGIRPGALTWFTYPGKTWPWNESPYSEVTMAQLLPGGGEWFRHNVYDTTYGLPSYTEESYTKEDGSVGTRTLVYAYDVITVTENSSQYTYRRPFQIPVSWKNTLTLSYNDNDGYTTVSDSENNTTTIHHNGRHQITGIKHPNGLTTTNIYGTDGFLVSSRDIESGAVSRFTFNNGLPSSSAGPLGLELRYSWDKLDRLTGIGFPDNTYITNIYNRLDLTARKDRLNNWTRAGYDNMRQLSSVTNARNFTTRYYYCTCGALDDVYDPLNNQTHFGRDNVGNVTNVTFNSGLWTRYKRNIIGQVTNVTTSAGQSLDYYYNNQGLVTCVKNSAGTVISAGFDDGDRPVAFTNAYGDAVIQQFDAIDRLKSRQNARLVGTPYSEYFDYSPKGLTGYTDALGFTTLQDYDPVGRLSAITNANLEVTRFGYDAIGNLTSLTDGRTNTTHWAYDKYGRQISETNANRVLVRTNGYDANGRLVASWTAAKGLSRFNYDANGNVVTNQYPGMAARSFAYDQLDRLTSFYNGSDYSTLTYTNFGAFQSALASESTPWMGSTVSKGYTQGRLSSITAGSWTQNIGYDTLGRPETFSSPAGTFTYGYGGAAGGRVAALQMPGGLMSCDYEFGQVKHKQFHNGTTDLDSHSYDYDLTGLVTNITRLGGIWAVYGYDPLGQLVSAQAFEQDGTTRANEDLTYGYDPAGNLLSRTNRMLTQGFVIDRMNQLVSASREGALTVAGSYEGSVSSLSVNGKPTHLYSDKTFATVQGLQVFGGRNLFVPQATNNGALVASARVAVNLPEPASFHYDLNGNLISDGRRGYEFNGVDQLERVTETNAWKSEFVYDALGRRRATRDYSWQSGAWTKTNEVRYVYDAGLVVQELTANNTLKVSYTRGVDLSGGMQGAGGIGGLLARTDGNSSAFYHSDASGNVTAMVNGSGTVVARYLYDSFGNSLGQWGPLAEANTYRFSSKEWHANSGLYYYGFRFYDPGLQRWINQDPLGIAGGINLHGFVGNDPMNAIDALGLNSCPRAASPVRPEPWIAEYLRGGRVEPELFFTREMRMRIVEEVLERHGSFNATSISAAPPRNVRYLTPESLPPETFSYRPTQYGLPSSVFFPPQATTTTTTSPAGGGITYSPGANSVPNIQFSFPMASDPPQCDPARLLTAGTDVSNAGGIIRSFAQQGDQVYYRVFSGSRQGRFLTAVPPSSSAFAREALALPPGNQATYIQEVLVPNGTVLQRSRALPAFGARGGAEQFELLQSIPSGNFGNGTPLP